MINNLPLLALMATIAIGAPLQSTNEGRGVNSFTGGGYGTTPFNSTPSVAPAAGSITNGKVPASIHVSLSASRGFNWNVAKGIEASIGSVPSGFSASDSKADLLSWIKGAGASYFDPATCFEIEKWCNGAEGYVLAAWAQKSVEGYMAAQSWTQAAGGVWAYFNGLIEKGAGASGCACEAMAADDISSLSAWLAGEEQVLDSGIKGFLTMCAAGGYAESLSIPAQSTLSSWLAGTTCELDIAMKSSVASWLLGGKSGEGSVSAGPDGSNTGGNIEIAGVTLTVTAQSLLSSFINTTSFQNLSPLLQSYIQVARLGSTANSLSPSSLFSFSQWLSSSACTLPSTLKSYAESWIAGEVSTGTQAISSISAAASGYSSMAGKIAGNFQGVAGVLTITAQSQLQSFISSLNGTAIDASYKAALELCAAGKAAISMEAAALSSLASWIASSSCSLDIEMRGTVLAWMSFAQSGYTLSSEIIDEFKAKLSAIRDDAISASCKGVFAIAMTGQDVSGASIQGVAEMSAFLCGGGAAAWGADIEAAMFEWVSGTDCDCN